MQLTAEKEILIVVASLVHCCAIKNNVIVASRLYDVADVKGGSRRGRSAPLKHTKLLFTMTFTIGKTAFEL